MTQKPRISGVFSFLGIAFGCTALLTKSAYSGVYVLWTDIMLVYMIPVSLT